jgi:hypothetical protein
MRFRVFGLRPSNLGLFGSYLQARCKKKKNQSERSHRCETLVVIIANVYGTIFKHAGTIQDVRGCRVAADQAFGQDLVPHDLGIL